MEFHQMRYFVAAAEAPSFSQAARDAHVTQPAMSRQIALLEQRLGVNLFDRHKQRVHLTEAGRFFLPKCKQILCDAETARQQVRERFGKARRTLRLGFLGPFLDDLVAPCVRDFKLRHKQVAVSLFDLPPRAQLERLAAHELDAAILANLDADHRQAFRLRVVSRHRTAIALPEAHPLARQRRLALARLADADWVSLADAFFPGRRAFLVGAAAGAGFAPRIALEVDSVALMLGAVAAGDGVALVPRHSQKLPHAGVVFVPLAEPAPVLELLLLTAPGPQAPELAVLADLLVARAKGLDEGAP
jgi:DNA-binding transcriptional LysR family regulator